MNKRIITVALTATLGAAVLAWAHDEKEMKMPQKAASPEFQQLKRLAGNWKGTSTPMGPNAKPEILVTEFEVTAAGSAIEETLMKDTPHEMVDMYTDEGGKLAMTHYCAMGNHPHMVLKQAGPHQITLEMGATPDIDAAKDSHMHSLTLEFPDADHLIERWTNYTNGKPGETAVFTLARVK